MKAGWIVSKSQINFRFQIVDIEEQETERNRGQVNNTLSCFGDWAQALRPLRGLI